MTFNPDDAAQPGSGIFGLPHTRDEARIIILPVAFDATTSYGRGTAAGPDAVREASFQVDLLDPQFGRVYEQGIYMLQTLDEIRALSEQTGALAGPIIEKGGADMSPASADLAILERIAAAGERVNEYTFEHTRAVLTAGKLPALLGGEHSTPFGAIRACAEHCTAAGKPMGILHLDAHMDFRDAFEGFRWSHASIMHNVMSNIPEVSRIVQVGIRDFGEGEVNFARALGDRAIVHTDAAWSEAVLSGTRLFSHLAREAIEALPDHVYVSFDIDALDPSMCPHTGTPVPGGLSFHQACLILKLLRDSGRTIVGFDLVEVAPGPGAGETAPEIDASVGARILYKLCGAAAPR